MTELQVGIWVLDDAGEWHWSIQYDGHTHLLACRRVIEAGEPVKDVRAFDADDPPEDQRCPDCQRVLETDDPASALPTLDVEPSPVLDPEDFTRQRQAVVEFEFTQRFAMRFPQPNPRHWGVEDRETAAKVFAWGRIEDGDGMDVVDTRRKANYTVQDVTIEDAPD